MPVQLSRVTPRIFFTALYLAILLATFCAAWVAYYYCYLPSIAFPAAIGVCGNDVFIICSSRVNGQLEVWDSQLSRSYDLPNPSKRSFGIKIKCSKRLPIAIVQSFSSDSKPLCELFFLRSNCAELISVPNGTLYSLVDDFDGSCTDVVMISGNSFRRCTFNGDSPSYTLTEMESHEASGYKCSCINKHTTFQWSPGEYINEFCAQDSVKVSVDELRRHLKSMPCLGIGFLSNCNAFVVFGDCGGANGQIESFKTINSGLSSCALLDVGRNFEIQQDNVAAGCSLVAVNASNHISAYYCDCNGTFKMICRHYK